MVAASILPVTIYRNKLLFLFGKENELEDSAKGWSDFGGRVNNNESIFQGAIREGCEELTGFLGNENELRSMINNNGGTYKLSYDNYHIHFFYLPYDKNLPKYYNQNHSFLWNKMNKKYLSKTKLFEKIEINWFSIQDIKRNKKEFRHFYQDILERILYNGDKLKVFINNAQSKYDSKNK